MEPLGDEKWPCLPSHTCWTALPGPAACQLHFLLLPRVPRSPSNCVARALCFRCKSIAARMSSKKSPSLATKVGPQKLHIPPWPPSRMSLAPWWGTALPAALASSLASAFASLGEVLEAQAAIVFSSWVATVLAWFREHHRRGEKMVFISFHVSQDSAVVLINVLSTGNLLESGLKRLTQSQCRHWRQSKV